MSIIKIKVSRDVSSGCANHYRKWKADKQGVSYPQWLLDSPFEIMVGTDEEFYTKVDMESSFEAGLNRDYYEQNRDTNAHFAPDFAQFMDGLNTSKSMP